jgi:AcrR family transcriptional regulator
MTSGSRARLRGAVGAGRGQVGEVQRARLLAATAEVVAERGVGAVTVAHIVARSGVSRRTFYDLFDDREQCFLAAFEDALTRASATVVPAYQREDKWLARVRAGLTAVLEFFDDEPQLGRLVVVEALGAGPRVLERRARVLAGFRAAVDQGRGVTSRAKELPPLTAEGVVGAVFSVVHARMLAVVAGQEESFTALLGGLMGMIVLPYLGPAAAAKELTGPASRVQRTPRRRLGDPLAGLDMRLTYRTLTALGIIARAPGASNREVAAGAGISDQGQVSKLLTRLEGLGLIHNGGPGAPRGAPNAWTLTPRGEHIIQAIEA